MNSNEFTKLKPRLQSLLDSNDNGGYTREDLPYLKQRFPNVFCSKEELKMLKLQQSEANNGK